MGDDAFKCFWYLKNSAPQWLSDITKLEQSIEEKQKQMAKMPQERPQLVSRGSIVSIREEVISSGIDSHSSSPPKDATPQSPNRRPNLLIKRSKRPGSTASTLASGTPKFRTRSMVIVYYDAEIQKGFEQLVREVGNGRNLIRKGKMAARMEALTSELDDSHIYELADGEALPFAMPHFRRAGERTHRAAITDAGFSETPTAFDKAETSLEKAQSLCEKAAHQFLRDGDCRLETEGTKAAFEAVLQISTEELPRLEALEQSRQKRMKCAPPSRVPEPSTDERPDTGLTFGSIEVDDDDVPTPLSMPELRMLPQRTQRRTLDTSSDSK